MRIACLHLPQYALQCVTRIDPSLRGAAIAVVGCGLDPAAGGGARVALHSPVVQACSRAAWAVGVRVGMTAVAARALSPEIKVVQADPQLERETVRAIADVLLAASPVVDLGGRIGAGGAHLAMYCEVPGKTRGTSFGDRLLLRLETLGLTGRIGIADDRFTAWVAASAPAGTPAAVPPGARDLRRDDDDGVVSVPRGGSAAFLAPRPLSLLAITPEVQHMLEALGVRTLGEFAALPAPSVARPMEADYQALARGDSGQLLRPYTPDAPIREEVCCSPVLGAGGLSTPAALAVLADRIAQRLAGRGRSAARLELTVSGDSGERIVPISPLPTLRSFAASPSARTLLSSGEAIADAIGAVLRDEDRAAWRLRVVVNGEALAGDELIAEPAADGVAAPALTTVAPLAPVALALDVRPGGSLDLVFGLSSPTSVTGALRSERRDAHRRTRRGKQRRRVETLIQPRLFKNLP